MTAVATLERPSHRLSLGPPCFTDTGLRLRSAKVAPSARQVAFLGSVNPELLYGGAAGGGKSLALLQAAAQFSDVPGYHALLLRRTLQDLKLSGSLIPLSHWLFSDVADYNANERKWTFPSRATIEFGYLRNPLDHLRYQGSEFAFIGFDELTQFPDEAQYEYLFSRLRRPKLDPLLMESLHGRSPDGLSIADVPLRMRAATNPGGPGHCVPYGDVLTPTGWRDIRTLAVGDPVYQVAADGSLEATVVRQVHRHRADEVVEVNARGLHMAMTPEHKVAKVGGTRSAPGTPFSLVPWDDLPGQATVLRSTTWEGTSFGPVTVERGSGRCRHDQPSALGEVDYAAFLGWFLSEGYLVPRDRAIGLAQSKPDGRAKLAALLDRCGFTYSTSATGFTIYAPDWHDHLAAQDFGLCRDKYVPRRILDASPEVLAAFVEAAMDGDGHRYGPESGTYYTTSARLADDMAEALVKLGYIVSASQRQRSDRDGPSYAVNYKRTRSGGTEVLTGHHRYRVATTTKRRTTVTRHAGPVATYCIGVDSHAFVLRQRGTVWVSGNSWVRRRFIDPDTAIAPFLPASWRDNPALNQDDDYALTLARLSEVERRRLDLGDWDVVEVAGALWRFADIVHVRVPDNFDTIIIGVDPAVSEGTGDEAGIVAVGFKPGVAVVLEDASLRSHPDAWAKAAVECYHRWGASRMVVEANQGGELNRTVLYNAADLLGVTRPNVLLDRAATGESKEARAQPVSQAYKAKPWPNIVHAADVAGSPLEAQMTSWVPGDKLSIGGSPDRVDAMVWAVLHGMFRRAGGQTRSSARSRLRGKVNN